MPTYQTTAGEGAGPAWQPLGSEDYGAIGFTTFVDVAAALLVVHVVSNRGWPPYTAAIPQIIVFSNLAAIVATLGVSLRYGMWGVDVQDVGCTATACLVWLGLGALFSTAFLRVYRYHNVLVSHSGTMWPVVSQFICLLLPFTLPPAFLASPDLGVFESNSLECQPASRVPELFAFGAMGIYAFSALVLAFRLRVARTQAPCEFESAVTTSATLLVAAVVLPLVHSEMDQDRDGRRVAMLVLTALTSVGVVASPMFHPLKSFIVNEEALEKSGNYSLGEWRSKEKKHHMRLQSAKFQQASSSEREIEGFPAIAEFFRVVMAREEIESYPKLQASTMRILNTYFRKGATSEAVAVPLSDECRSSTLMFRASSSSIFDRARGEILEKMGIGKALLQEDEDRAFSRTHSTATTGASSQSPGDSPASRATAAAAAAAAAAATTKKLASSRTASHSSRVLPLAPPSSRASSTSSSLQYSTCSESDESPQGLSPLHPPPSSPVRPDPNRRSAEARATNVPEAPMSPPLNYRGVDRNDKKKKEEEKNEEQDKTDTSNGGGGGDSTPSNSRKNPIFSLFGRLGGGAASSSRVHGASSEEPSPSVVHMADDTDFDGDGIYGDGSPPEEQGRRPAKAAALGRTLTGGDNTGVRTVAKVMDVHAAFGLAKKDDDDDDEEIVQHRPTGFLGAVKKKKKKKTAAKQASASSGIGGYGNVLSTASSSPDGSNDLAEAARAIPKPLFGDSSRAVGRQRQPARSSLKSSLKSTTSAGAAAEASTAFASSASLSNPGSLGGSRNAGALRGHSLDLADAYGLDLAEEGGEAAEAAPSPRPKTATVNPLFGDKGGGGGRVKAMARAFDAEAQAQAVSAGLVAVDNNNIGLPGRPARKKRGGKKKGGGGGGGDEAANRLGASGSSMGIDVYTIEEGGEDEDEEEEDDGCGSGGQDNAQNV